ncbi:MAG: DUF3332 family protein [Pseudomonadota bacterium]|jgi:hypothetical protein|uniref:DUF3332 family protein n=1 Tax=Alcanivorax sp. TaxID=1872427 RepID=UPI002E8701FD|nr:DUF3332 family protein [Pseudomonadota bacterium]
MKKLILMGVCASSVMLSGCLGHNALFNNVQDWNANATDNKWINQGISFGFWIVPVYPLTLLGDTVLLNSIEYWTGTNPVNGQSPKVTLENKKLYDGMGNVAQLNAIDENTVAVTEVVNGEAVNYALRKEDGKILRIEGDQVTVVATATVL